MHRFTNTTSRNIAWLRRTLNNDQLEIRPPFQRNPVWTDRQKSYLIDSILKEYPIPELYMQEVIDHEGNEKYIVVDGQQRVRACLEYVEGKYALNGEDSPDLADIGFEDLSPEDKKKFFEYSFVVRQLPEMPEEELRGIFQRLNRNVVALNAQELRHATYWGAFIKTMEKIAEHEFWSESGIFSSNDIRRMLDVEFISELAVAFLHGPQNKKQSLDSWYEVHEREFEKERQIKNVFNSSLGELSHLIPNIAKTRWRKKSDFYTLFLVFANHAKSLPLASDKRATASDAIIQFGSDVNRLLEDITKAEGFSKEVIEYAKNVERSASDIANRKRRSEQLEALLVEVW